LCSLLLYFCTYILLYLIHHLILTCDYTFFFSLLISLYLQFIWLLGIFSAFYVKIDDMLICYWIWLTNVCTYKLNITNRNFPLRDLIKDTALSTKLYLLFIYLNKTIGSYELKELCLLVKNEIPSGPIPYFLLHYILEV